MVIETKVNKNNQTNIPIAYIKKFNIKPGDLMIWEENSDGKIIVSFRKRLTFKDLMGSGTIKTPTNAIKLEKELYK